MVFAWRIKSSRKIEITLLTVFLTIILTGCNLGRRPLPLADASHGQIAGIPKARCFEIEYRPDISFDPNALTGCDFLAISGGGANGAFGAGFLNGWTASGMRPKFKIVTGISTGALIAPMAFLGLQYDIKLEKYYTTVSTKNIMNVQGWLGIMSILTGESYASTRPLQHLIAELVDDNVLKEIAKEYANGRRLYIGTTNLDTQRFVVWDMGAIAASGCPGSLKLFRKVMLASASIPGAFPPVYFDVELNGRKYDEMHVDAES